ncbi:dihydrofolate reductase family protein [Psychromicrobium sp. YIM B11713]|uniref:dihydrofolate reductase family protein n=1 Tax=Psychromicrobium sp. YIM B11713 TaxID=3145233 RepID=UPI00374F9229
MGKVIYYSAVSIDGFIATEEHGLDWLFSLTGFTEHERLYAEFYSGIGALVMGAETYRFLLDQGEEWPYQDLPCWVFSHSELPRIKGAENVLFVHDDVSKVHSQAVSAAGEQDVWMVGGGNLAAQFHEAGLLNELYLSVVPFVLGSGKRLLPISTATSQLELLSQRAFGGGVLELRYAL